jgi:DNA-binding protein H-NS
MAGEKMTIGEIQTQIERLQAELVTRRASAKGEIRSEIDKLLSGTGLNIFDIYPNLAKASSANSKKKESKVSSGVKAIYKDPASGDTWSGRGRSPKWVSAILQSKGITIEQFKASGDYHI